MRTTLLPLLLCLGGRFHVDLYAPRGREIWLISSDEPVEVERRWHLWFVAWGASLVNEEQADQMIEREQLTELRLVTEDNIPDAGLGFLYNILIPIGIVNQTLVLQGNRAKPALRAESCPDRDCGTIDPTPPGSPGKSQRRPSPR